VQFPNVRSFTFGEQRTLAELRVIKIAKRALRKTKDGLMGNSLSLAARHQFLTGRMASWAMRAQIAIPQLDAAEFQVHSQGGQDGIIDWLIERAEIPVASQIFIEFGVEDYQEANTHFLLENRNWRGLIIDGNPSLRSSVERQNLAWKYNLTAVSSFITRENVNDLFSRAGFSGEIGLLSVDIDGNDYWVWEAIEVVNPILVVCEFNAVFGDIYAISTPYSPDFQRGKAHFSNLYFGASVNALRSLAAKKGYRFVGTNSRANDCFFVREDYAAKFVDTSIGRITAHPSNFRESRDKAGVLNYVTGLDRIKQIAALPVVNVDIGETIRISELGGVYSEEWIEGMATRN
jgi:hypothetical protein